MNISNVFRGLAAIRPNDVYLVSYPKAGNTYLRFLLYYYLKCLGAGRSELDSFDNLNDRMPELFHNNSNKWFFESSGCPKLVKSHHYLPLIMSGRTIGILREPVACLNSYYRYCNALGFIDSSTLSFSEFIRGRKPGARSCIKFQSNLNKKASFLCKFEDLVTSPNVVLSDVISFLGLDVVQCYIELAVELSSFENTRRSQRLSSERFRSRFKANYKFANKGNNKLDVSVSAEDLMFIDMICGEFEYPL